MFDVLVTLRREYLGNWTIQLARASVLRLTNSIIYVLRVNINFTTMCAGLGAVKGTLNPPPKAPFLPSLSQRPQTYAVRKRVEVAWRFGQDSPNWGPEKCRRKLVSIFFWIAPAIVLR
jgi:hypothetical protein